MNHVFALKWNPRLKTLIPVPETLASKRNGSRSLMRRIRRLIRRGNLAGAAALAGGLALCPLMASGLPVGPQVVAGKARVSRNGAQMTISQSTDKAILNWNRFGIAGGETVTFHQPGSSSVALNRVLGHDPSAIYGHLNANGQVFLVNPNGIYFAPGAQVDVGGIVASTLGISNSDFLGGHYQFNGSSAADVRNAGTITAHGGGYVAFLGHNVSNDGAISAPDGTVALGAGAQVDLTLAGNSLLSFGVSAAALKAQARNGGVIKADGGAVILSAKARDALLDTVVNSTGVVRAQTAVKRGGVIQLLGGASGTVKVTGTLDASAPNGGDGGRIETSGAKVTIAKTASVNTKAPNGKDGRWLIDPKDFTIAASGGDVSGAVLSAALAGGSVTIQTAAGSASCTGATCAAGSSGLGDINVNDTVSWNKNTLTLSAYRDINVNTEMKGSGTAGLAFDYGQGASDGKIGGTVADYFVNAPVDLATGGRFSTKLGSNGMRVNYTIVDNLGTAGDATTAPPTMTLQGMAAPGSLSGNYVLGSNIDASATSGWNGGKGFAPIGYEDYQYHSFSGDFDGLGHKISDLNIDRPSSKNVGLFGLTYGNLRDINLLGGDVSGKQSVGALDGFSFGGIIDHVSSSVNVSGSSTRIGGLIGGQQKPNDGKAVIRNSQATGNVSGLGTNSDSIGGLVGSNNLGTVSNSFASGAVSGSSAVGGLVGYDTYGVLQHVHATGAVIGKILAGGLVGSSFVLSTISDAYATGDISTDSNNNYSQGEFGGLVGGADDLNIKSSYASGSVSGTGSVGGLVGAINSYLYPGTEIKNVHASGVVTGTERSVGGLIGVVNSSSVVIINSYATGNVTGKAQVGGFVGSNSGVISNSHATGSVYSTDTIGDSADAGGFAGVNSGQLNSVSASGTVTGIGGIGGLVAGNFGSISNASALGIVTAESGDQDSVGGLVGSNAGSIKTSYAASSIGAKGKLYYVGGLVGYSSGSVSHSYWDLDLSLAGVGKGGLQGTFDNVYGLTSAQMHDTTNFTRFNFTTTPGGPGWVIVDNDSTLNNASGAPGGTLPMLASEYSTTVTDAHQLQLMAMAPGASYKLGGNVDAGLTTGSNGPRDVWLGSSFVPVGSTATPFTGSFDGGRNRIANLTINLPKQNNVGLFGVVGAGATIRNARLTNPLIVGGSNTGALAGNNAGTVQFSYDVGSVTGTSNVGGIVGQNGGTVSNSYAAGVVKGRKAIGGLVGSDTGGTISDAYAIDTVTGTSQSGALVGLLGAGTIANSFYYTSVNSGLTGASDHADGAGLDYGMTKTAMQTEANFTSTTAANGNKNPGWDFSDVWTSIPSSDPLLLAVPAGYAPTTPSGTNSGSGSGGNNGSSGSSGSGGGSSGSGASGGKSGSGGSRGNGSSGGTSVSEAGASGAPHYSAAVKQALEAQQQAIQTYTPPPPPPTGTFGTQLAGQTAGGVNGVWGSAGPPALTLQDLQQHLRYTTATTHKTSFEANVTHYTPLNGHESQNPVQQAANSLLAGIGSGLSDLSRGVGQAVRAVLGDAGRLGHALQQFGIAGAEQFSDALPVHIGSHWPQLGTVKKVVAALSATQGRSVQDISAAIAGVGGGDLTMSDIATLYTQRKPPAPVPGPIARVIASGGGNFNSSTLSNLLQATNANSALTVQSLSSVIASGGGNFSLSQAASVVESTGGHLALSPILANYVIASGGGNVIASGGGNVIASGGGNVIASGGGNFISLGDLSNFASATAKNGLSPFDANSLLSRVRAASVIASGGGNVIASGGGNVISSGGGNIMAMASGLIDAGGTGLTSTQIAAGLSNMASVNFNSLSPSQFGASLVQSVNGAAVIASGGGNVIATGGGN